MSDIKRLIKQIKKLNDLLPELEKLDKDIPVLGNYDEGGYCDGSSELEHFNLSVDICEKDEYYTNGLVVIDVEMETK